MNRNCWSFTLLLFLSLSFCGCSDFVLNSSWKDKDVVLDGKDADWLDKMVTAGHISFGLMNDDEFLYICLSITDKVTKAQMMGVFKQEFSIWFDPEGKQKRTFGIRFSNDSPKMDESLIKKIRYLKTSSFQFITEEMMSNLLVDVVINDNPVGAISETKGIDVAAGMSMNGRKLTYELRVPLARNEKHPYAIGVNPGEKISVGLEASDIDMDSIIAQMNGGTSNPSEVRYRVMQEFGNFEYLRMWGKVQLSKK